MTEGDGVRNAVVEGNLGLVSIALREAFGKNFAWHPWLRRAGSVADAEQVARLGLVRAASLYDPARGFTFSTYAVESMRRNLRTWALREGLIRLPGAIPRSGRLRALRRLVLRACYLPIGRSGDALLGGRPDPALRWLLESAEDAGRLPAALDAMPGRLSRVLRMRHLEGLRLREIGGRLGVSKERARRLVLDGERWLRDTDLGRRPGRGAGRGAGRGIPLAIPGGGDSMGPAGRSERPASPSP